MGQRDADYQLSGIVEMDDGSVGGSSHKGKRGRGTKNLDAYCFRFNRRMTGDPVFRRLTRAIAASCGVLSEVDQHKK